TISKRDWSSDVCSSDLIVINTKNTWLRIFEKTINIYFAQARIISSLPRKKTISDPIQPFFHTGKTDTPGKLPVINYNEWRFIMRSEERRVGKERTSHRV